MIKRWMIGCFLAIVSSAYSQVNFEDFFEDATLRLDYVFAGSSTESNAYLHQKTKTNHWYGRRAHLDTFPVRGQAQLRVTTMDGKLVYMKSFGSLFQEWQTIESAKGKAKSFEQTLLMPFPKEPCKVTLYFYDTNQQEYEIATSIIDPSDILIKNTQESAKYKVIHPAKVKNPVRIALVAEGYTAEELPLFMEYAQLTVQEFFKYQAFKSNEDAIEFVAVPLVSEESGISVPREKKWVQTALGSHFDTFYSERYLTTPNVHHLHELLSGVPYQHIIILANTATYGGGGILNSYSLTTTKDPLFKPVVVHEFGHSFAGLADEYFYEVDVLQNKSSLQREPWEKNNTTLVDFASKWQDKVQKNTPIPTPRTQNYREVIGAFEGLKGRGIYIPTQDCRMQNNTAKEFCPVCTDAIDEMIHFYSDEK